MNKNAFLPADILIPTGVDLSKWSVIACDQFSSERDYWERVAATVGSSQSTLKLIVPEVYLGEVDTDQSAQSIGAAMENYLLEGLFKKYEQSYIYLERTISDGRIRRGLVGQIDLECYDFLPGSESTVRASEKTIVERLPARIDVRRSAVLELPHIMALINDRDGLVIEPLGAETSGMECVYNFELMEGGGAVKGWQVTGDDAARVNAALSELFEDSQVQLIIGDGNHSLAAAKSYWDEIKKPLSSNDRECHPARFALVELNNVYDPAIDFEAIHRVVMNCQPDDLLRLLENGLKKDGSGREYSVTWITEAGRGLLTARAEGIGEFIEMLQTILDDYVAETGADIDYIHGDDSLELLSKEKGAIGFLLPTMDKSEFFSTVLSRGQFPRKSFSIGHARDKRYYLECRTIH